MKIIINIVDILDIMGNHGVNSGKGIKIILDEDVHRWLSMQKYLRGLNSISDTIRELMKDCDFDIHEFDHHIHNKKE